MNKDINSKDSAIIDIDADDVVETVDSDVRSETVAPPPKPVSMRRGNLPLFAVALLAGGLGGAFLYRDVLSAYLPTDQVTAMAEQLSVLQQDTAAAKDQLSAVDKLATQLKSDVDTLEGKQETMSGIAAAAEKAGAANAERLAAVETAIADAKQAISALPAQPQSPTGGTLAVEPSAVTALQQRLDALEKEVASLKAKPVEPPDTAPALSQALASLKTKVAAGAGFASELETLESLVPAAAGLDTLRPHAAQGLPDAKRLGVDLKALIPDLPKPIVPGPVPESEGWWASIYNSLSELIVIRVEGDVDWPTAAAAAVAFADAGDLPQAIEKLNAVAAEKPPGIQQWLDRAQARVAVEAAVSSVEDAVLRVLAAKG